MIYALHSCLLYQGWKVVSDGKFTCLACMDHKSHHRKHLSRHEQTYMHKEAVKHRLNASDNNLEEVDRPDLDSTAVRTSSISLGTFDPSFDVSIDSPIFTDNGLGVSSDDFVGGSSDDSILWEDEGDMAIMGDVRSNVANTILDFLDGGQLSDIESCDGSHTDEDEGAGTCIFVMVTRQLIWTTLLSFNGMYVSSDIF